LVKSIKVSKKVAKKLAERHDVGLGKILECFENQTGRMLSTIEEGIKLSPRLCGLWLRQIVVEC
jgi:hypothetical protein